MGTKEHKAKAPKTMKIAVLSISTTRKLEDDKSGHWIAKQIKREGHQLVSHQVVDDDMEAIRGAVLKVMGQFEPQALLLTGGTGISRRDVTIEAMQPLFAKELTAFGILFSLLSFEEIDSAAILSRATAGIIGNSVVFCVPGSLKAVKLACKALIFPELGHILMHIQQE
jgi:molybdenum cofactor biosynthesis protein B